MSVCVNVVPPFYHANSHHMLAGRAGRYTKEKTMGMTSNLKQLTLAEFTQLKENPNDIATFLFPDDVEDPFEGMLDLDKSWHALHYLICLDIQPNEKSESKCILGGEEIGEDLGYGPARLISPELVKNIDSGLKEINVIERYDQINKEDPIVQQLYCSFEFFEGEKEHYNQLFSDLKKFYAQCTSDKSAAISFLA